MIQTEVAIVGGGLAGLYAAHLLHEAGVDFVVLEARHRLGGRILSADEAGLPSEDGFDLGPSWYWPQTQPELGELIAKLGLTSFGQNGTGHMIFERMSKEVAQRYQGLAQEQQSMRLTGGTGTLVRALAQGIPREKLLFGHQVTEMILAGDGIELTTIGADGAAEKVAAAKAIAALPPRLLEAKVKFTPDQEETTRRRWRETATWMAPHAKFFALYDRPFWREAGLSGTAQSMVGPMAEIHDATTAAGKAALFGFLSAGAEQRAAVGEEALTEACLTQFARLFGQEARTPRATIFKDWAADPLTATTADRIPSGHLVPGDGPWVLGPWEGKLVLAGSETSQSEPGYLAGAIDAAARAIAEILDGRLRKIEPTGGN